MSDLNPQIVRAHLAGLRAVAEGNLTGARKEVKRLPREQRPQLYRFLNEWQRRIDEAMAEATGNVEELAALLASTTNERQP